MAFTASTAPEASLPLERTDVAGFKVFSELAQWSDEEAVAALYEVVNSLVLPLEGTIIGIQSRGPCAAGVVPGQSSTGFMASPEIALADMTRLLATFSESHLYATRPGLLIAQGQCDRHAHQLPLR